MTGDVCSTPALDLGFLEPAPPCSLLSRYFPSKVGGKPAWLALKGIPAPACPSCKIRMTFLLQLYAPLDHDDSVNKEHTFHRTLFVFFCRNGACHRDKNAPFAVYRSQLPKNNGFYPATPASKPEGDEDWRPQWGAAAHGTPLCAVCGGPGDKKCSGCKEATYCAREHQVWHWKKGGHRDQCKGDVKAGCYDGPVACNLPEFEIVIEEAEEEDFPDDEDEGNTSDEDGDNPTKEELEKYKSMAREGKTGTLSVKDVKGAGDDADAQVDPENVCLTRFKETVEHTPEQVVRHCRRGKPLWIALAGRLPEAEVPKCEHCGSERVFEFQVMPQLLNKLKLDAGAVDEAGVDWGVLAIYTCENSCDWNTKIVDSQQPSYYKKEFIYRQNIPAGKTQNM